MSTWDYSYTPRRIKVTALEIIWDMKQDHLRILAPSQYTIRTTGPQGGRGKSPGQHRYHRVKLSVSCQCSHMSNHQCMMSYAQGSSVGTTSTSVPECSKETPDRLAVEPSAQQDHNNHRVHRGEEQNHMDRTTRTTGTRAGGAESPTQHRCDSGDRPQQEGDPYHGGGGGRNPGSYITRDVR